MSDAALLHFDPGAEALTTAGLAGRHVISVPVSEAGIVRAALESAQPVNVADVTLDPRYRHEASADLLSLNCIAIPPACEEPPTCPSAFSFLSCLSL